MIQDRNVRENAKIASTKINFARASDPAAATNFENVTPDAGQALWYNTANGALKVSDGSGGSITLMAASQNAGTLQAVYDHGTSITPMDAGTFLLQCADADDPTYVFRIDNNDTTGNPVAVKLENAGTGNDITADNWSVTQAGVATVTGLDMVDGKYARFGTSQDATLTFDGTTLILGTATDDVVFEIGDSADPQLSWDVKIYGNTASGADYLYFDASDNRLYTTGVDVSVLDGDFLTFGTGASNAGDITMSFDETDFVIDANTADLVMKIGATNNMDVAIYGATATDFIYFDTDDSAKQMICEDFHIILMDDTALRLGDSADVTIDWNAAGGLDILAAGDNSVITWGSGSAGFDWKLYGGDSSTFIYYNCDGGSGTTGQWAFGQDDHGVDVIFYGATASANITWDESANQLVAAGGAQISLNDAVELLIGTGVSNAGDFKVSGTSAPALVIDSVVAETGTIEIGADDLGLDVTIFSATASAGFVFDASGDILRALTGSHVNLVDDGELRFGTGASLNAGDLKMSSNSSNVLQIEQCASGTGSVTVGADGKGIDWTFYGETASASMMWDQSGDELLFSGGAAPAFLGLANCTLAQVDNISATGKAGQMVYLSNGAAGSPALGVSDGTNWLYVALDGAAASE